MTLQELDQEEVRLREALSKNLALQSEIYQREWFEKYGVKINDEIIFRGNRGVLVKLTGSKTVSYAFYKPRLKSGGLGREKRIWSFEFDLIEKA